MRILTSDEMKQAEDAAVLAGTSYEQLMENAGSESARLLEALAGESGTEKSALFLCGRGNNAGDAFVMARLLAQKGWQAAVCPLLGQMGYSLLAKRNLLRLPPQVAVLQADAIPGKAAFVVDGVFGTGFRGVLPPQVQAAFARTNAAADVRVALDVPSGMNCDDGSLSPGTFHGHHTFTFGAYKPGLLLLGNAAYTGKLHCLDIGL